MMAETYEEALMELEVRWGHRGIDREQMISAYVTRKMALEEQRDEEPEE